MDDKRIVLNYTVMKTPVIPESLLELQGLPKEVLALILRAASKSQIHRVALVGGAVRDGLLGQDHCKAVENSPDIDLVVEGSAYELGAAIKSELRPERISLFHFHSAYNTVEMRFENLLIDLATARVETYSAPGENPKIEQTNIEQDLARRDFSINAIAIDLSTKTILDPFKGRKDLEARKLQFLHPKSVEDDPTRIIRAARYAARLDLALTEEALQQIQSTIKKWPWNWSQGMEINLAPPALSTRLRQEIELLLKNEPWEQAITLLQNWGAFPLLEQRLQYDKRNIRRIKWALKLDVNPLTALIAGADEPLSVGARLQLPANQLKLLKESMELERFLQIKNEHEECKDWNAVRWCKELEVPDWSPQAVAITISKGGILWQPLLRWFQRWRYINSPTSAKQLLQNGWEPGPGLGFELKRLREEQLESES